MCEAGGGDDTDTKKYGDTKPQLLPLMGRENYAELEDSDFEYTMTNKKRGLAVIINNDKFDSTLKMGDRPGSSVDRDGLVEALKFLGFKEKEILVYNNLTGKKMNALMEEVATRDFTYMDCLLIAILSHGDEENLFGTDRAVRYSEIFDPLKSEKAASLIGKPKIFLIQACRGQDLDSGIEIVTDASPSKSNRGKRYLISRESDFLVAYSTVPGYFAWRNGTNGSWFIQAFCEVMRRDGRRLEFGQLLARVNRMVSYTFMSNHPDPEMNRKKQSPCITSTLTKSLFFTPK